MVAGLIDSFQPLLGIAGSVQCQLQDRAAAGIVSGFAGRLPVPAFAELIGTHTILSIPIDARLTGG